MKPKKRQKLCHHCEGEVDLDVIVCPFCAADLREVRPEQKRIPPVAGNFTALGESQLNVGFQQTHPSSALPSRSSALHTPATSSSSFSSPTYTPPQASLPLPPPAEEAPTNKQFMRHLILCVLLFSLGIQCLLLGVLQLLFVGVDLLVLEWETRYWFLYISASLPMLIFGYRALKKIA